MSTRRCTAAHNTVPSIAITITDLGSPDLPTFALTIAKEDTHIDFIKGYITRVQAEGIDANEAAKGAIQLAHALNMHTACEHP